MAWIELHQAVWTHRKTFELAAELGLDETYAAAHVIRLWCWALDNAPDGNLSHLSARAIAYGAGWRGAAESFLRALVTVGWLDEEHGLHDWDEYAGRLVERRRADAERKRNSRGQLPDVQRTSGRAAAGVRRTVPDRTLPDTTGPDTPPKSPPAEGTSAAARRTQTHRKSAETTSLNGTAAEHEPLLTAEELAAWATP